MEISWDRPFYYNGTTPFFPCVSEGSLEGYNAVTITLEGGARSDLSWKAQLAQAQEYTKQGYALFWDINLGLFDQLRLPLDHQAQFLSLTLTLEHFRDTLWQEWREHTLGVSIYRGSLDFSRGFKWSSQQLSNLREWIQSAYPDKNLLEKEIGLCLPSLDVIDPANLVPSLYGQQLIRLFCRDVLVEYLSLLSTRLPDPLPCYLCLDAQGIDHPLWEAQLLNPECFSHLNLALRNHQLPWNSWEWGMQQLKQTIKPTPSLGICFPPMDCYRLGQFAGFQEALPYLLARQIDFRIIAESDLVTCWDGLDHLIVSRAGLSPQGKRKLQGFCAAGGTVVSSDGEIGLSNELDWQAFANKWLTRYDSGEKMVKNVSA